jgi:TorA maturation chaperone TorD
MSDREPATPPPVDVLRALAVLVEPPTDGHAAIAEALGVGPAPDAATYSDVFLFQLYPYASVHRGSEGMLGGEAAARIAGFWRAVGRTPPAEPDHLAALLGLYASLAAEVAAAAAAAIPRPCSAGRRVVPVPPPASSRSRPAPC